MKQWDEKYLAKNASFDLIREINQLHANIILASSFGVESTTIELPYIEGGVTRNYPFG